MPDDLPDEAVLLNAGRMTDVMSRVAIDVDAALRPDNEPVLAAAARGCECCACADSCDSWIAAHDEGEAHEAPDFCPSARLMQSLRPASLSD